MADRRNPRRGSRDLRAGSRPGGKRPGRPPGGHVDPPRATAFDVLRAVDERDAYANLLLPSLLRDRGLTGRDAALTTELTYGTLRGRGTYDEVIAACSDRALTSLDPPLLDALRLGVHQLLRTRIPSHAAVNATVELVRLRVGAGPARYANAVLRRVASRGLAQWLDLVAPPADDPIGRLSVIHSHPRWIVSALRDAVGVAEIEALLVTDNERPRVTLVARPGLATVSELLEAGAEPAAYSPYAAYLPAGDPVGVPAVAEGRAAVQDEASQLVALALSRVAIAGNDATWLDMCAGPGGKAALLAAIGSSRGARLIAADVQLHRARLVRRSVSSVVAADGTVPAWPAGSFDRVLVDAPCSGLGALRRRPEARWRRTAADVDRLGPLQRGLLSSAFDAVRPGGVVAYVTCSPHLAETRVVVSDVEVARGDVEVLDAREWLPEVDELGPGPYAQFWPHRHGTDAMFIALLRKSSP